MERMELVELVREKAGVSYTDAKEALDASEDDLLDALVWLEGQGRAQTRTARSSTEAPGQEGVSSEMRAAQSAYERSAESGRRVVASGLGRMAAAVKKFFRRGMSSRVVSYRGGEKFVSLPLLVAVVGEGLWLALAFQGVQGARYYSPLGPLFPLAVAAPVAALFYLIFACRIERPDAGGPEGANDE